MPEGKLYGFGLSEANLNRMEFNNEPIFFDFGYAGNSNLFGLILYLREFREPADIAASVDDIRIFCLPFFDRERGVTPETLRVFPFARSIMQKFRDTPYWGFDTYIRIAHKSDMQMFFAGRDEKDIEQYLRGAGLISPETKRAYKGFEKRS